MNALFVKELAGKLIHPERDCRLDTEGAKRRDDAGEEADAQHERGIGKQHHPFVGRALKQRQDRAPARAIAHAWAAQQRLYRRYQRLAARGKPTQHIVTAVARELTGFLWATLIH